MELYISKYSYNHCQVCDEIKPIKTDIIEQEINKDNCCIIEEHQKPWPPYFIKEILNAILARDFKDQYQRQSAIVLLCSMLDILFEIYINKLIKHKTCNNIKLDNHISYLNNRYYIKIFNNYSDTPLDILWKNNGLIIFYQAWDSLCQLRNKIINNIEHITYPYELEIFTTVLNDCLKAFAILHNDVNRQINEIKKRNNNNGLKILVIDNEEAVLKKLSKFVEQRNGTLYIAKTGKEGINIYKECKPDCIFLEVNLPDIDGFKVLEEIKSLDSKSEIYIISDISGEAFFTEITKKGANGLISKPINIDEIMIIIESLKR